MQVTEEIVSYSAVRGTVREYETVLILRPDTNKDGIAELVERLQKIMNTQGARLQSIDNWGLRTLAFPVKRCKRGIYLYFRFLAGSNTVAEMERILRIREDVLRYLSVRVDEDVDPNARPSEIDDESLEAASESAPDPVEIAAAEAAARAEAEAAEAAARAEAEAAEAAARAEAEAAASAEESNGAQASEDAAQTPAEAPAADADKKNEEGA